MDFRRRFRTNVVPEKSLYELKHLLIHNVMFYIFPPMNDITLHEFEELATERLKILRIFESASAKYTAMSKDWKDSILREMNGEGLKGYTRLFKGNWNTPADMEARRRDYLSHFILRFAYCQSEDLKRWFVKREMDMFRFKFSELSPTGIREFKNVYHLKYEAMTETEKSDVKDGLYESTNENSVFKIEEMDFYKVPFTQVLDLVSRRNCYLKNGFAYVSASDFVHIIGHKYERLIYEGLEEHALLLPELENDERLWSLVKGIHTSYTGKDYTVGTNDVAIENLDQLSKKSYPLCMRMCHDHLRKTHHLKHNGRLQYGLFLKGIGVTLEDSLRFWREEFCRTMDPDKFEREHRYNIRYNYGKEGKRQNWAPWSCMKTISSHGQIGDVHGCPFKIYSVHDLKSKLTSYGISSFHAQEVLDYAQKGHYQVACGKYFEVVHDHKLEEGINHPNHYFDLSQEVMGKRQPKIMTPTGAVPKHRSKDIVLKKKKMQDLMKEEDDIDLWNITQAEETQYFSARNEKPLPKKDTNPKPSTSVWDDEDDLDFADISNLDDSIAMEY